MTSKPRQGATVRDAVSKLSLALSLSFLRVSKPLLPACLAALALAPLHVSAASKPAASYSNAVATAWLKLDILAIQQTPGQSPPAASRTLAYLGLGLYEAVVNGMPKHRTLAGQLNELESLPPVQPNETLHWPTVANATLAALSRMLLPNAPPDWKNRMDKLERDMPLLYPEDFSPDDRSAEVIIRSETYGKLMAMALMTWARTDGGHDPSGALRTRIDNTYVGESGPGAWVQTPPQFARPLLPNWGNNRRFVPGDAAACPLPGPPPYSEAPDSEFFKQASEVFQVAKQTTEQQRQIALYWSDDPGKTPTPSGHWAFVLTDLLRGGKHDLAFAAEASARMTLSMSDAFVATWQAKYRYNLIRPVTYVQLALDSNWVPDMLETPPFPEYPSGHSVQSGAAALVLGRLFGEDTVFVDRFHNDRGWGPRTFKNFKAASDEAAISRMYGGIHFRAAIEDGLAQGRCVGEKVMALQFLHK